MTKQEFDPVKKPKHYQGKYGLEAMTVIENFMWDLKGMAAADFKDVMKYLLRFQKKNGLQDLWTAIRRTLHQTTCFMSRQRS